jgi:hypothetical protein
LKYNSLAELYAILIENAEENNYSEEDVNELFSLLLTQRNKEEYFNAAEQGEVSFSLIDIGSQLNSFEYPISILERIRPSSDDSLLNYQKDLINLNPTDLQNIDLLEYIYSFSADGSNEKYNKNLEFTSSQILKVLYDDLGDKYSVDILEKASTTRELDQFYFNLLITADKELKNILTDIDFDSLNINNSIDLVKYLYDEAEKGKISVLSLIAQIEKSIQEEHENLDLFKETLANAATGELKLSIQELETNEGSPEIAGIVESILRRVNTKGYSKAEVYDLLIKMIGINDVELFVQEMRKYSAGDMDSLLIVVDKNQISTPLEVIKYLLTESPYFDFSDSDINSLLIRMILEKGVEGHGLTRESSYSKELMNKNRLITTLILANILVIILIILFWRRKKKKQ